VLEYPVLLVFPIAMIYAAAMDFFTMTIPNRVSLALVAGFFAAALLGGLGWLEVVKHVSAGVAVLAVTIVLFARGWIGGGDAKLMSATVLWFGFDQLLDYAVGVALLGGLLTMVILSYRNVIPPIFIAGRDWAERLHDKNAGVPYGVALGGAALWVYPTSEVFRAFAA
jgi:prepilin peptidase CpaA